MQTHIATNSFSLRRYWLVRGAAALLAIAGLAAIPGRAHAGVFVSVSIAPPALPVYVQPAIPGPGYIWTPGYWAWGDYGYYWVPGTWVLAPFMGALWTPGYWGWSGGVYLFHVGYWGRHVGFYGGINYGYGYGGFGYDGGYWRGGGFYYNRTVNHVTNNITNVYNKTVINNTTIVNRTSYNGGPQGIAARATQQQMAMAREQHTAPVAAQMQQRELASRMPSLRASENRGMPAIAATPRAGAFTGHGIVAAHGAPTSMAASERRYTPAAEPAIRQPGALRSAGFAPHAGNAMQAGGANRYTPSPESRNVARPNSYEAQRNNAPSRYQPANNGYRESPYRAQGEQAQRNYQPQSYRPEQQRQAQAAYRPAPQAEYHPAPQQHYAQPAYRPGNARPAAHEHAAPQGRRDDKNH